MAESDRPDDLLSPASIRRALRAWSSTKALGTHPLAGLTAVAARRQTAGYSDTPAGRGLALRETLQATIEALRPSYEAPDPTERRWRPYIILTEQYLHGRAPDWVMAQLHVSRRAYYYEQKQGIQALADALRRLDAQSRRRAPARRPPFLAPPRPMQALVGRERLLGDLKQRLLDSAGGPLFALHGLPGVGKTALVSALAHDPDIQARFADGVLWAGLGRQPDVPALLGTWAEALGVPGSEITRCPSPAERARVVHAAIGLRRLLLVIDDAWQTEAALAFKVGGPGCAHFVTTRLATVALDTAGSRAMPVHELDAAAGLRLLAQVAPQVVAAELAAAQALVAAVGGLPLALILIGGHLRKQGHGGQTRRLREALAQLQTAEARLRLAQPQAPLEQRPDLPSAAPLSLQAAIGISDTMLPEAARQALRDLALLPPKPNTFAEAAAQAVAAVPANVLDALVDYGLLEGAGPDRYTLHQTIADYARLAEASPGSSRRLVDYYVQFIAGHAADHTALDRELSNLLVALETACEQQHAALVHGVQALAPYLARRGLYALAEPYLSHALAVVPEADHGARYGLLLAREEVYDVLARREAQQQDLAALRALAETLDDDRRRAEVALRRSSYAEVTGDYPAAVGAAQEAVRLAQVVGAAASEAAGHLRWGRGLWQQADCVAAAARLQQAITLARAHNQPDLEAEGWRALTGVAIYQGDYGAAQAHSEQALRLFRTVGDRRGESITLANLGVAALNRADYGAGRAYYEQALGLFRQMGDRYNESRTLGNLGGLIAEQGDYAQGWVYAEQALGLARESGDRLGESMMFSSLGNISLALGDYAGAQAYLEPARQLFRQLGHRQGEAMALYNLALSYHHLGDHEAARRYGQQALHLTQEIGTRYSQGFALTYLGHALLGLGHLAEAAAAYQQAVNLWRELGQRNLAMEPRAGLARVDLVQGAHGQALAHVEYILDHLTTGTLDGTDEPLRIYLTCYRVLHHCDDSRDQKVLKAAHDLLQERAARISDVELRRSFLEQVEAHREIREEWRKGR